MEFSFLTGIGGSFLFVIVMGGGGVQGELGLGLRA